MNGPTAAASAAATAVVIAADALRNEVGRAVVLAVAVLIATVSARWLWKAILRQFGAEVLNIVQPHLKRVTDTLNGQDDRLTAVERRITPVDNIIDALDALTAEVAQLRSQNTPTTQGGHP
jgi:ABC-type transport system involved in cytochrome bd biosynthesis fused ATPase/permease subunit